MTVPYFPLSLIFRPLFSLVPYFPSASFSNRHQRHCGWRVSTTLVITLLLALLSGCDLFWRLEPFKSLHGKLFPEHKPRGPLGPLALMSQLASTLDMDRHFQGVLRTSEAGDNTALSEISHIHLPETATPSLPGPRLTTECTCILGRNRRMSGGTICYAFFVFKGSHKRPFQWRSFQLSIDFLFPYLEDLKFSCWHLNPLECRILRLRKHPLS